MKSIEDHIAHDKEIIADPIASPAARRHAKEELHELEIYHNHHPDDHHDPNALELFCDLHPDELNVWYMTTKWQLNPVLIQ